MKQIANERRCWKGNEKWLVASSAAVEFVAATTPFAAAAVAAAVT